MNQDCLKLTTYFGERDRTDQAFVADELLELYGRRELDISILLRGAESFGSNHHLRTDRLLTLSEDLPLVSIAVDTRPRILDVLPEVLAIKRRGLITLERARLLSEHISSVRLPEELHDATKLTLYVGRHQRIGSRAAFVAISDLLYRNRLAGATCFLGVDGTVQGIRQRARFFGRNVDVPMMIIAVGSGEQISAVLPELGSMLPRPLMTLERVQVCKRDGTLVARPPNVRKADDAGLPIWQKLMVYTSEQARHRDSSVHTALVRALRKRGARGATCVRGVWGFQRNRPPHGDRFWQLRRDVPVVTIIVDAPDRIGEWFDVVDEVTRETGLVTSELVPAAAAAAGGRAQLKLARPHSS